MHRLDDDLRALLPTPPRAPAPTGDDVRAWLRARLPWLALLLAGVWLGVLLGAAGTGGWR